MEELKIGLERPDDFKNRLAEIGAEKSKNVSVRDTYLSEQGNDALKITVNEDRASLKKYESRKSGFELVKNEEIEQPDEKREELREKYGVKADQKKTKTFYTYKNKTIIINKIEDLDTFLIVQGEKVEKQFIEDKLGIENPEYIEVPFSDLE